MFEICSRTSVMATTYCHCSKCSRAKYCLENVDACVSMQYKMWKLHCDSYVRKKSSWSIFVAKISSMGTQSSPWDLYGLSSFTSRSQILLSDRRMYPLKRPCYGGPRKRRIATPVSKWTTLPGPGGTVWPLTPSYTGTDRT